ncbi:MAG: hypothetical protein OSA93_17660, partial [Akkermansiaceae bacterium]|nr:hypothetical protein [Akkermansiaceae bacterium]
EGFEAARGPERRGEKGGCNTPQNGLVARDAEAERSIALDNKIAIRTGYLNPVIASGCAGQQVDYQQADKGVKNGMGLNHLQRGRPSYPRISETTLP